MVMQVELVVLHGLIRHKVILGLALSFPRPSRLLGRGIEL